MYFPKSQIEFYFVFAMAVFSSDVANNKNKLMTLLGGQTSILEEFMPQSSEVATNATIDTLVIEID